jgi:hypothetical protein
MGFDKIAERRIREAMAEGRLDVVADGRKLDLDEYFKVPEDLRMAYSILKTAGCVPEEVEHLKEVDRLRTALNTATTDTDRQRTRKALAGAELRLSLALERARRR